MFNFNELEIVHPNEPNCPRGSFVGIRKDKYLGKMVFTLPKGFDNFEKSYDNVKKLFFLMYRTFEKFRQSHEQIDEKLNSKDNTQINNHQGAYTFTDEDNNETILYSKIDLIERIFKTYQELEIESLIQELGLIEEVDYSKIENYLDKGIYLNNNAIFIENMQGYRNIVRGVPSELIELFCYIYKELANELEQELSEQIKEIAFNFSYNYLSPEQSLFSEYSFDSTIRVLKDCLDNIHKTTAYKNYQYWDIYEAVEHFLYGSLKFDDESTDGYWGIDNFSYIWEDMCNFTVLNYEDVKILYCDTKLELPISRSNLMRDKNVPKVWIDKNLDNIFNFELNGYYRYIRPDIIFERTNDSSNIQYLLDNGILKTEISKSMGFFLDNINVDFYLTKSDTDEYKKEFGKIYQFLLENIKHIQKSSKSDNNKVKKLKPQIRNLTISKNSGKYFTIKNIPQNLYNDFMNQMKEQDAESSSLLFLIDWKYYSNDVFPVSNYRENKVLNTSIIKQLTYEFCLSQFIKDRKIYNQFCIPSYSQNDKEHFVLDETKLDCGIALININFLVVQEIYLNGGNISE